MEWKSTLPALSLLAAASTLRHRGVWTPWTVFWFAAVFARTSCSRTRQHDHHSNRASSATPAAGPRALTRISLSSSSESAHGRNGPKTACQRAREHEGGTATAGAAHGAREGYLSAPRPPTQRPPSSGRGLGRALHTPAPKPRGAPPCAPAHRRVRAQHAGPAGPRATGAPRAAAAIPCDALFLPCPRSVATVASCRLFRSWVFLRVSFVCPPQNCPRVD